MINTHNGVLAATAVGVALAVVVVTTPPARPAHEATPWSPTPAAAGGVTGVRTSFPL